MRPLSPLSSLICPSPLAHLCTITHAESWWDGVCRQEAEEGRGEKSKGQPTSHVAIVDMRGKEAKLVSGSQ
eukprot:278345-Rhodomonas_salina.1